MNQARIAPPLGQLQRWFASVTTNPQGVLEGAHLSRRLERLVTAGPKLSAVERLRIYSDGYVARLVECLLDDYPALAHALGDETFEALCRDYIAEHPSRSRSLNGFGQAMAAFCAERAETWAPCAADLARLEWALVEVVHEPQTRALTSAALAAAGPGLPSARFVLSPCLRLLRLDYPVNAFYQAYRDGAAAELPERAEASVAVFRQELTLWRQDLEPLAALLLDALGRGETLESAVALLANRAPYSDLAAKLPQWLGSWVENGFFQSLEAH
jgi:hypothetical protein